MSTTERHPVLHWLRRSLFVALAVSVILVALAFSAFRLALTMLPELQELIETEIGLILDKPLDIGSIDAEWDGWGPKLVLKDVSILSPVDQDLLVGLRSIKLGTHLGQLLSDQPQRPTSIDVEGLQLVVEQQQDGMVAVRGFDGGGRSEDFLGPLLKFLAGRGTIELLDSQVFWLPYNSALANSQSSRFDIRFRSGDEKYSAVLDGALPGSIGRALRMEVDVSGDIAKPIALKGEALIQLDGVELHSPWMQPWLELAPLRIQAGIINTAQVNLRWNQRRTNHVGSYLDMSDVVVDLQDAEGNQDILIVDHYVGDLSWAGQEIDLSLGPIAALQKLAQRWQINSDKGELTIDGKSLRYKKLGVQLAPNRQSQASLKLEADAWKNDVTFEGFGNSPIAVMRLLSMLQVRGGGEQTQATLIRDADLGWTVDSAQTQLHQVAWRTGQLTPAGQNTGEEPTKGWPGLSAVSGQVIYQHKSARLEFAAPQLTLDWPWLYPSERQLQQFNLQGRLSFAGHTAGEKWRFVSDALHFQQGDSRAEVSVAVSAFDAAETAKASRLKLNGSVSQASKTQVFEFMPNFMPATAKQWLDEAIKTGRVENVKVAIDGPLSGVPYPHKQGQFEVTAAVKDVNFEFHPDWPLLTDVAGSIAFKNTRFSANLSQGETAGLPVHDAQVRIADLLKPVVNIDAQADVAVPRLLAYVKQSPLLDDVRPLVMGTDASGRARLQLGIEVPVENAESLSVNGNVLLRDAGFYRSDLLQLSQVNGPVKFDRKQATANGLALNFHGFDARVTMDLGLTSTGDKIITAKSRLDLDSNVQQRLFLGRFLPDWFMRHLHGDTAIDVDLSGLNGATPADQITLRSDLRGLAFDGPKGFVKTADSASAFVLHLDRRNPKGLAVDTHAQGLGGAVIWLDNPDNPTITKAEFALGSAVARLPKTNRVGVVADIREGAFTDYLNWWTQGQKEGDVVLARNLLLPDALDYLRFKADRFVAVTDWNELDLELQRNANAVELVLTSIEAKGRVRVPDSVTWASDLVTTTESLRALQRRRLSERIEAKFDYLYLPDMLTTPAGAKNKEEKEAQPLDPRLLPVVDLEVNQAKYMGVNLGRVKTRTVPALSGLVLKEFSAKEGQLQIDASGRWDIYQGQHHSALNLSLEGNDWAAILAGLDKPDVFQAKHGRMAFDLNWPSAITRPKPREVGGSMSVDFKQGEFYQVDPGVGRLLGLFSFYSLPKRLLLDFSDLAADGLQYERIKGDLTVADGSVWAKGLQLSAPAADATMIGRTGFVARDYDQQIIVQPRLGEGTALVGALVSGVGVGALMLLANEVLGHPFDELGSLRWNLTGSWDNPVVNGKPMIKDEAKEPKAKGYRGPRRFKR